VKKVLPSQADVVANVLDGASLAISDFGQLLIRTIVSPPITDVMKALSDPVRWSIVTQMAATDELACTNPRADPLGDEIDDLVSHQDAYARSFDRGPQGRPLLLYTLRRDILAMVLHSVSEELGVAEDEMTRAADGA
jgi:hypothetical protein